jgi:hypothetical protein
VNDIFAHTEPVRAHPKPEPFSRNARGPRSRPEPQCSPLHLSSRSCSLFDPVCLLRGQVATATLRPRQSRCVASIEDWLSEH